jgi:hypothetical protein
MRALPRHIHDGHKRLERPTIGYVEATYPSGNDGDPLAVPSVYHDTESEPAVTSFTLEVDGELFALRPAKHGGTDYTWLSGPNKDYGFSSSMTPNKSLEVHREGIRAFLAQIDPTTGYIEDD